MNIASNIYSIADSTIVGCFKNSLSANEKVSYKSRLSLKEKGALLFVGFLALLLNITFVGFIVLPSFNLNAGGIYGLLLAGVAFVSILLIELIRILQFLTLWFYTLFARDPLHMEPSSGLRVAILTTIVPNKEPLELVLKTLKAMKEITYNGKIDVWLLDEGNDPYVKNAVEAIGVKHFSRKGILKYNQEEGLFKAKTKSGNHNSWRDMYESNYDVVGQMDPDHTPFPNFLERTIGYFSDPDIAFVVAPQVYGNQKENRIAKASAGQAYIFHGVIQRGANGLGIPLLIGTNHIYRTKAWKQIGGYQDSIIEDHLTSMKIYSEVNPSTGSYWKGLYTPDVLSVGEGPQTWSDYFNQQKRWAYGICEIILKHDWNLLRKMEPKKALGYMGLQMFYPSVAVTSILGILTSFIYFGSGVTAVETNNPNWMTLWTLSVFTQMLFYFWLARFNLTSYEKSKLGIDAIILTLFTIPIYTVAVIEKMLRKPLTYAVTAKGALKSQESLSTFNAHIAFSLIYVGLLVIGLLSGRDNPSPFYWNMFLIFCNMLPIFIFGMAIFMKLHVLKKSLITGLLFVAVSAGLFSFQNIPLNKVELVKANSSEISSPEVIKKEKTITINETPVEQTGMLYQVQEGDTLWSIAKEYYNEGSRWNEIVAKNPELNNIAPNKLSSKSILRLEL